ncbi:OmpA family protein [Bernardetia sp. Wsw4-3y2]|uniref:OmpA family protein n=1 Tax=Bernardetia sp. Wsw4-3y2 TaxID=3127471 RepID=UPI0030CBC1A7
MYNTNLCSTIDSEGRADLNLELSVRRSDYIKTLLVNQGVASERIISEGQGQKFLIVPFSKILLFK